MTLEQGKPLKESRGEIEYAASFVEWYAEEAKRLNAESVTSHLPGAEMIVRREPVGVVGVVTPWNFPAAMLTRKAAAALAAGCTVVAHPSSETPLSALALAELGERAGLPAGVFNVLTGKASDDRRRRMCDDARVRAMSFTGSTEIGRLIAAQCAPTMKRLVMELGGHAPLIVFDDADLDKAVQDRHRRQVRHLRTGLPCRQPHLCAARNLRPFHAPFAKHVAALSVGAGVDDPDIGPLDARAGRRQSRGTGRRRDGQGRALPCRRQARQHGRSLFYQPTLLVDVPDDALIMREETFGPVAAVTPFDTEDEVVARANDTEYGLVAYVVTENGRRQLRLGRALDYGMVAINRVKITGAPIPFGGVKQSGLGREGSRHGIEAFTDLKYLCIDAA